MKALRYIIPGTVVVFGLLFSAASGLAKPEFTKKEKKGCVTCHVKTGSKELNDTGKHYKEKKTLEGAPAK
ncbi:MAG: hypothetical protein HYZ57_19645 [Acidobacteria bacterium]|nr:hypothetical protein [Acidobacteriota bacterium]MBI3282042.1 hypothetical protein [Acidobacteriota bacterium]